MAAEQVCSIVENFDASLLIMVKVYSETEKARESVIAF